MNDRFTEQAREAVNLAGEAAIELAHNYIGTEHILIGLIRSEGVASRILEAGGVEEDRILELVSQLIAPESNVGTMEAENFTVGVT